jgi:hypothetical protein
MKDINTYREFPHEDNALGKTIRPFRPIRDGPEFTFVFGSLSRSLSLPLLLAG